jgi:sigma-E factor negative regulatory protein RseC
MIEEQATVVEVNADQIVVQTLRKTSCNSCGASKACGAAVLAKAIGQKHSLVTISKAKSALPELSPGDQVIIGINESMLLSGSMLAYLAPLGSMIAFALIASWLGGLLSWSGELHIIFSAFIGLFIGLLISRFSITKGRHRDDFSPVLLKKQQNITVH